jgi:hypothetical protein
MSQMVMIWYFDVDIFLYKLDQSLHGLTLKKSYTHYILV